MAVSSLSFFFSLLAISASTECASLNKGDENYVDPRRLKVDLKLLKVKIRKTGSDYSVSLTYVNYICSFANESNPCEIFKYLLATSLTILCHHLSYSITAFIMQIPD